MVREQKHIVPKSDEEKSTSRKALQRTFRG